MQQISCLSCNFSNSSRARICESCRKSLIIDNYGLTHLYLTFDGFLEPFAEALQRSAIGGTTTEELLSFEVYSALVSLANHEGNISGNEARLIREVRYNLYHDISLDGDIPTIREFLRDQVKPNPTLNVFDRQNDCLTLIASNDAIAGTNYARCAGKAVDR
jgi:hypothetical protein